MHDIDTKLLLFFAWAGTRKRLRLAPADLDRLSGAVRAWRETVMEPSEIGAPRHQDARAAGPPPSP